MAVIKLELDPNIYESFLDKEISIEKFLTDVFNGGGNPMDEMDEGSKGEIIGQLLSYHSDEGAAPECDQFDLTDEVYDEESKSGKVNINYNIGYYFACADMNTDHDHYLTVNFNIDVDNEVLIVHFIDHATRSTHDEF